jgi:hypothetical protein
VSHDAEVGKEGGTLSARHAVKAHASFDRGVVEAGAYAFCPCAPLITDDAPQVERGHVFGPQMKHRQHRPAARCRACPALELRWRVGRLGIGVFFDDLTGGQQLGQPLQFPNLPLAPFASA